MEISEKIRTLRKRKHMTQVELAKTAGISVMTLRRYENGDREPKITVLNEIAQALGTDLNYFYDIPQYSEEELDMMADIAAFSAIALEDETLAKIAKLLMELSDQQLRQVYSILEALYDNPQD